MRCAACAVAGSAATNQPPPGASVLRQRQPRKKAPAKNKAVVKSSSVPVTSEASADSAQPPQVCETSNCGGHMTLNRPRCVNDSVFGFGRGVTDQYMLALTWHPERADGPRQPRLMGPP